MKITTGSYLLAALPFAIFSSVQSFAFVGQINAHGSPVSSSVRSTPYSGTKGSILQAAEGDSDAEVADLGDVGFVLLAGGTGSRMKANMPKQFLELKGVPVLHHSLDLFLQRLPAYAKENGKR